MRKHYLDNIRWVTVVIVVIYHAIYMYNGVQPFGVVGAFRENQYQDAFLYLVYPWFMTLLFVVSGMSARYYLDNHTNKEFIKTRTRKLLVPSTLGLLVFQWITGYYNMQISHAFDTMPTDQIPAPVMHIIFSLSGIGVLWYVQMLWVLSLLLVLIVKIEKDKLYNLGGKANMPVLLLFTVLIYLSSKVLNTPMITVYRFGIYGAAFFIGYFVMSHEEVTDRLMKFWLPLSIASVILGITYTVLYFGENYAAEPVINNLCACVYCWIAILAVIAFMKKWFDRTSPFADWMNKRSWGLYVFHYLPLTMVAYYLSIYAKDMPPVLCYLIVLISEFAFGYLLNEIISRIPVVRWFVLGIKRKKE